MMQLVLSSNSSSGASLKRKASEADLRDEVFVEVKLYICRPSIFSNIICKCINKQTGI
jgi:hypothetical protein